MTDAEGGFAVGLKDLRAARERIRPHILQTPLMICPPLSQELDCELAFKCESLQHIGAFKARGACNAVFSLTDEIAARGVVTHSSGNHAAALSRAATLRGIPAHIVMPHNSLPNKLAAVRSFGVSPVLCEPDAESRAGTADRIQRETGATLIHPYDDPRVIAGQGSVGLEILEQADKLDVVVVPVGGGGLLSGILLAIKSIRPQVQVIAAEPAWADDAARSLASGRIEPPLRYDTIADGLRTPLGELTFPIICDLLDDILLVSEDSIRTATRAMMQKARLVAEPSGAVALAAVTEHQAKFQGRSVAAVVTGGNFNFDDPSWSDA